MPGRRENINHPYCARGGYGKRAGSVRGTGSGSRSGTGRKQGIGGRPEPGVKSGFGGRPQFGGRGPGGRPGAGRRPGFGGRREIGSKTRFGARSGLSKKPVTGGFRPGFVGRPFPGFWGTGRRPDPGCEKLFSLFQFFLENFFGIKIDKDKPSTGFDPKSRSRFRTPRGAVSRKSRGNG